MHTFDNMAKVSSIMYLRESQAFVLSMRCVSRALSFPSIRFHVTFTGHSFVWAMYALRGTVMRLESLWHSRINGKLGVWLSYPRQVRSALVYCMPGLLSAARDTDRCLQCTNVSAAAWNGECTVASRGRNFCRSLLRHGVFDGRKSSVRW